MEPSELHLPGGVTVRVEYDETTKLHTITFTNASGARMRKVMTSEGLHEYACKLITLYADTMDITPEKIIEGDVGTPGGWVVLE